MTTTPVSGAQYEITAGGYTAVVTESGAGLRALTYEERPLILSFDADELAPAAFGQLLVPWPNRVDRGRYEFDGQAHQLDITETGADTAIHGLVRWDPWTVTDRQRHRVTLTHRLLGRPGYPFCLDLGMEYRLDAESGLTVRFSARNTGTRPAPFGFGAHPYLTVGRPVDECVAEIPGAQRLPADERGIPSGPPEDVSGTPYDLRQPRQLDGLEINHAYTELSRDGNERAWARITDPSDGFSSALWVDRAHPWLQVFTADTVPAPWSRAGLAVEPMTCPPDAFVSGHGVIKLHPGEVTGGSWGIGTP